MSTRGSDKSKTAALVAERTSWQSASHSLGWRLAQSSSKRVAARRAGVGADGDAPAQSKALLLPRVHGSTPPDSRACLVAPAPRCCGPRGDGCGVRLAAADTCVSPARLRLGGVPAFRSALYTARAGAPSGARGADAMGESRRGSMGHERVGVEAKGASLCRATSATRVPFAQTRAC